MIVQCLVSVSYTLTEPEMVSSRLDCINVGKFIFLLVLCIISYVLDFLQKILMAVSEMVLIKIIH